MDHPLTALAEAVADGQDIDWRTLDVSAVGPAGRVQLEELRAVGQIGRWLATASLSLSEPAALSQGTAPAGPQLTAWGGLTIRAHVARGRFGDVFRAWDPAIERDVALKLLREPADLEAEGPAVIHEARLMARVRHPNVATIYGAARHEGRTGLWMEFVEGRTLQAEVRDGGPMDASQAAGIGIDLCRALAAVHAAGLVHRDVKAQNVLRDAGGRVVLGDFGTGMEVVDAADAAPAGTPLYLAPELWDGAPATPASDLYSLGALLFYLVTGRFPIEARSIADIREAHRSRARATLAEVRPDLPWSFAAVVERALDADPAARYGSAPEMERALSRAVQGARRGRLLAVLGIAVVALVAVAALTPLGARLQSAWTNPAASVEATAPVRRLSRVPLPDAQFWGQPGPDGRAFSLVNMRGDVAIFDVHSGTIQALTDNKTTGGSAYQTSAFSPDGSQLAYGWQNAEGRRELRLVEIASRRSWSIWQRADEIAHPIDWSSDGSRLLVLFERRDGRRLAVMDTSGNGVVDLTPVQSGFTTARLTRDGERVLFDDFQQPGSLERDIFSVGLRQPGEISTLVGSSHDDFAPLLTPDGDRLLFVSDRTGEPSIWAMPADGTGTGEPVILHRNMGRITPNGLGRDGTLYYTLQVGLADIYEADLEVGAQPAARNVRPLAPGQVGSKVNSHWSRDGKLVYVVLPHGGSGERPVKRLAIVEPGTASPRLLELPLNYYLIPRWSPDGTTILVKGIDLQGRHGLFLVDAATGATRPATLITDAAPAEIGPSQWGADSRTILFTRHGIGLCALDVSSGREQLVLDFVSEGITGLVPTPGFRLSPDGRTLAYTANRRSATGQNETVLRVKAGGAPAVDLVPGRASMQDWTADGRHVLFVRPEKERMAGLWLAPVNGEPPVPLGLSMVGIRNASVHPGGRRITFTAGMPGSEVWALANFLPEPEARR